MYPGTQKMLFIKTIIVVNLIVCTNMSKEIQIINVKNGQGQQKTSNLTSATCSSIFLSIISDKLSPGLTNSIICFFIKLTAIF